MGMRLMLWTFEFAISFVILVWNLYSVLQMGILTELNRPFLFAYFVVPFLASGLRMAMGWTGYRRGTMSARAENFADCVALLLASWFIMAEAIMIMSGFAAEATRDGRGDLLVMAPGLLCVLNTIVMYNRVGSGTGFGPPELPQKKPKPVAGKKAIKAAAPFGEMQDLTQAISTCVVCLDDFEHHDKAAELVCGHVFHEQCIMPWLLTRAHCPLRCELCPAAPAQEPEAVAEAPEPEPDAEAPEPEPDVEAQGGSTREGRGSTREGRSETRSPQSLFSGEAGSILVPGSIPSRSNSPF